MPIEVRRFGVGHRRPDGPPGTTGVAGQVLHAAERGSVAELAFGRGARMEPHTNPHPSWFIVIEGGGWAGVCDERTRVAAGEAVLWPADAPHAAWTEHSQMRAIVVEFAPAGPDVLEGAARALSPGELRDARGEGRLAPDAAGSVPHDPDAGEPV